MRRIPLCAVGVACGLSTGSAPSAAVAQCDVKTQLRNYSGTSFTPCPCFITGEQVGVILDAPAEDYPIEIVRVGIGWFSQFGGEPDRIEQAIHVYAGSLPDPGTPIFTLPVPTLSDGSVNEFDLASSPGRIVVDEGPFTVTLEFFNTNDGDVFSPSVVYDGDGCQSGKNVVFTLSDGWADGCLLGVPGDWVYYVEYRPHCTPADTNCDGAVDGRDIRRFVDALLDPNCSIAAADVNDSGATTLDDVAPFVECLLTGGCS